LLAKQGFKSVTSGTAEMAKSNCISRKTSLSGSRLSRKYIAELAKWCANYINPNRNKMADVDQVGKQFLGHRVKSIT